MKRYLTRQKPDGSSAVPDLFTLIFFHQLFHDRCELLTKPEDEL